jgi:hypothetical protein
MGGRCTLINRFKALRGFEAFFFCAEPENYLEDLEFIPDVDRKALDT